MYDLNDKKPIGPSRPVGPAAGITAIPSAQPSSSTPTVPPAAPAAAHAQSANDFDTNLTQTLSVASQQNGGQVNFNSTKDASEYNPSAGTGVITRAPGNDGLRSATFIGGQSAGDAARDKQFAEAGYGKDSYGNWMTPGRIADQQKAAAIDARDAKVQAARDARDAENYKAMQQAQASRDPNSTLNSMRDDRMISDLVERTKYGKRSERANATSMLNNMMNQRSAAAIAQQRMDHEGGLARERMGQEREFSSQRSMLDQARLGLDQQRLESDRANQNTRIGVDMARLGIDQEAHKGRMDDIGFVNSARQGLIDTANSKDPAAVNQARMKAIAAGIIKPEVQPKNEYATNVTTNPMGTGVLAITRTNKDTGAVDLIDPATGKVKSFGAGGSAAPSVATESAIEFLRKNPQHSAAFKAKYGYLPEGF